MSINTNPYVRDEVDYGAMIYNEFPEESSLIYAKVGATGITQELLVEVYSMLKKPRVLDRMPNVARQKSDTGIQSGTKETFISKFNSAQITDKEEVQGKLILTMASKTIPCDIKVVRILKALFSISVTKIQGVNIAFNDIMPYLLRDILNNSEYYTNGMLKAFVAERISQTKDYYPKQILQAMEEILSEN